MKRFLVRLTVLTVVVVLGLLAIAQAQRATEPADAAATSPPALLPPAQSLRPLDEVRSPAAGDPFGSSGGTPAPRSVSTLDFAAEPGEKPAASLADGRLLPEGDDIPPADPFARSPTPSDPTATVGTDDLRDNRDPSSTSAADPASPYRQPYPLGAGDDARYPAVQDNAADPFAAPPVQPYDDRPQDALGGQDRYSATPRPWPSHASDDQPSAMPGRDAPAAAALDATTALDAPSASTRGGAAHGATGAGKPGSQNLEGAQTPSLVIEKFAPREVQIGKVARFEIRLRNAGAMVAHDVEIHDEIPHGTRLVSSQPSATVGPRGELLWRLGDLQPGQQQLVEIDLLPTAEGELGSVATVRFAAAAACRAIATRPELKLELLAPATVMAGEEALLTIRVSNPGTGAATGIMLSEQVPPNLEHPAGAELEYEVGDLEPGDSRELQLSLRALKPGPVVNKLVGRGDGWLEAQAEARFDVVAPALAVAVDGPRRRYLDRPATYRVQVSNPGTAPAREIELVTYLPKGMQFVEANNAGQYDATTHAVYWSLEELPANQAGSVAVTTLAVEPGEQLLRVETKADRGLSAQEEESVVVEGVAAILFQLVDLADPIEVGGDTTYEVRVVNQGSKEATNVQLVALLPGELRCVGAEGPTSYDAAGPQVRFAPLANLAPKAETTYRIHARGLAPGDLRVRVQIVTDEIRTPVTKEESTRVYADE